MDNVIIVKKVNEVYAYIEAEKYIHQEISEFFKFRVPNHQFMPAFQNKLWDGFVRLYNRQDRILYIGLLHHLKDFAKNRNYILDIAEDFDLPTKCDGKQLNDFIEKLKLPFTLNEHQFKGIENCINNERALVISPTSSGKSVIIYSLVRWYNKKTLIIVPTINLVNQLYSDFEDYSSKDKSFSPKTKIRKIYDGNVSNDGDIVISTWQSIFKLPQKWFEKFHVVVGDEAHLFKATSLKMIMEKLINAKHRFGMTGTLDGTQTNKLTLEALFGSSFQTTTSNELMQKSLIANLNIDCIVLKYPEEYCKANKNLKYHEEIKLLINNDTRNKFICNLALNTKTNTLILFQYVDDHGRLLYDILKQKNKDQTRKIYFVSGDTPPDEREEIRQAVEHEKNAIIVASVGVFSTGINIKNLDNLIFSSPSKSQIRTLQSIGRILRIGNSMNVKLYDIVDDLSHKSFKNYALKHFNERVSIYSKEKFKYRTIKVEIKQINNYDGKSGLRKIKANTITGR